MTLDRIVVVGGSLAGLRAVQGLRELGFGRAVTVIGEEALPPYTRPPLSKAVLRGTAELGDLLFDVPESLDVQWRQGAAAMALDRSARTVTLAGGEAVPWDGLVIATGAKPRIPAIPGVGRRGAHFLRTFADAQALRADLVPGARLTVIGAGFIGCEIAASARGLGLAVTVIDPADTPLSRILGRELGMAVADLHRANGVEFLLGRSVIAIAGSDRVEGVLLDDGRRIETDVVTIGVGSVPATDWLAGSGLNLANGVMCTAACRAIGGAGRIVAAGDVANWPHEGYAGQRMRIEHWTQAGEQADAAAAALLAPARTTPFRPVLSLWSDQYGRKLQVLGAPWLGTRTEVVDGSLPAWKFFALSWDGPRLMGTMGMGMPGKVAGSRGQVEAAMTPGAAAA